jgi:hypothetical protein
LFLKCLYPDGALELAFKTPEPNSFAITIEGACIEAARYSAWRKRLYDILKSDDSTISARANKILRLSTNQPFIPTETSELDED